MLNILRLQAELQSLEHTLDETIRRYCASQDPIVQACCKDFYLMRENLEDQDDKVEPRDTEQIELMTAIGTKLQEYSGFQPTQLGFTSRTHAYIVIIQLQQ